MSLICLGIRCSVITYMFTAQRGFFSSVISVSLALHLRVFPKFSSLQPSRSSVVRTTGRAAPAGPADKFTDQGIRPGLVRASMALCLYCISTSRARAAIANYPSHPQYSISHHLLNGPHNNHTHVIQIFYNGVYS
ncbi:hypothetical protein BDR07DRAFT_418722 [Suillus spraguei]|nr:hypothetical protein BDR07DRAFT_418722 [Suillus spraguei]